MLLEIKRHGSGGVANPYGFAIHGKAYRNDVV
jgi:hypothetical protein